MYHGTATTAPWHCYHCTKAPQPWHCHHCTTAPPPWHCHHCTTALPPQFAFPGILPQFTSAKSKADTICQDQMLESKQAGLCYAQHLNPRVSEHTELTATWGLGQGTVQAHSQCVTATWGSSQGTGRSYNQCITATQGWGQNTVQVSQSKRYGHLGIRPGY